jgi:hypothetical protein
MAELYVEAHDGRLEVTKQGSSSAPREIDYVLQSKIISPFARKNDFDRGRKKCFNCNKACHLARDCHINVWSRESSRLKEEKKISGACTYIEVTEDHIKTNSGSRLRRQNNDVSPTFIGGCTIEQGLETWAYK